MSALPIRSGDTIEITTSNIQHSRYGRMDSLTTATWEVFRANGASYLSGSLTKQADGNWLATFAAPTPAGGESTSEQLRIAITIASQGATRHVVQWVTVYGMGSA